MPGYKIAIDLLADFPRLLTEGLKDPAGRDLCALECFANAFLYAKPDCQKDFILWEAKIILDKPDGIKIDIAENARERHKWVINLFLGKAGFVRFPFNSLDSAQDSSLSWDTIVKDLQVSNYKDSLLELPRWSTASRSCFVLIPEVPEQLAKGIYRFPKRLSGSVILVKPETQMGETQDPVGEGGPVTPKKPVLPEGETLTATVSLDDWNNLNKNRFFNVVKDYGNAASDGGIEFTADVVSEAVQRSMLGFETVKKIIKGKYRLYSVKTGVTWVGSANERGAGKNLLEHNSALAQVRSNVIESYGNRDLTFGIQTEVLTVTAPTNIIVEKTIIVDGKNVIETRKSRDGFQVRDLSCLQFGLNYLPCQAIPHGRASFDSCQQNDPDAQCRFWRKAFAIPLGRAKARLLLNFGLIHMSANAQNFLLGFQGPNLKQFVARDIGDTSWHDLYIERYFAGAVVTGYSKLCTKFGLMVIDKLKEEKAKPADAATLYIPEEGNYPAPQIMRLAANSALTHGFGNVLEEKHKWKPKHLYEFATGILDGFRDFIQEALLENQNLYPALVKLPEEPSEDEREKRVWRTYDGYLLRGVDGRYPPFPIDGSYRKYQNEVDNALAKNATELFMTAASIRQFGMSLKMEDFGVPKKDPSEKLKDKIQDAKRPSAEDMIGVLINAEELHLCAGLEKLLGTAPLLVRDEAIAQKIQRRLGSGRWPSVIQSTQM